MGLIDLIKPVIVQTNRTNPRMDKQGGTFILSGLSNEIEDAQVKLELMLTNRIDISYRLQIL